MTAWTSSCSLLRPRGPGPGKPSCLAVRPVALRLAVLLSALLAGLPPPLTGSLPAGSAPPDDAGARAGGVDSPGTRPPAGVWPSWRGPLGTGAAPAGAPPAEWSEERNVLWKIALPGKGHSTPVVWGDNVFVTTAIPYGDALPPLPDTAPGAHDNVPVSHRQELVVLAVSKSSGKILWQTIVNKALPHDGGHYTASYASGSPATDGERLFAFFGSFGLHALDTEGKLLWSKDFGLLRSKHGHGEGSSPALYGKRLVVNWDHEGQSFVVALDTRTGDEVWRSARDEDTSWASPIVIEREGKAQAVVSGTNRVRGYDLETGGVIWECGGLSDNVVASPVYDDGMVFAASSYTTQAMLAIRIDGARGDLTGTERVVWTRRLRTPYVPSPLLYDGALYFLRHYQGILYRVDAKTGKELWRGLRLEGLGDIYSSPVAAAGRIYITGLNGVTEVWSAEPEPKLLARNSLDDAFSASAAISGDCLLLRGAKRLYCLAAKP